MLRVHDEKAPLRTDSAGYVFIGDTRVTIDCVVEMFEAGASAEQIADEYDLELSDVYMVVGYYLRHVPEVKSYLESLDRRSDTARQKFETAFPNHLREKLLRARAEREGSES